MKINTIVAVLVALPALVTVWPAMAQTSHTGVSAPAREPGGPASHPERLRPETAQEKASFRRADDARKEGEALLDQRQFAAAEADFREALELEPTIPFSYPGLGEALEAQGRSAEAVQAYRTLFTYPSTLSSTADEVRAKMGYAISLSKAGKWPEAVAVYEGALPDTEGYEGAPRISTHFDPQVLKPGRLQALAYVASGVEASTHDNRYRAFLQFSAAVHADPDSALANYCYGFGWRMLPAREQARSGRATQARAALQRAIALGGGDLKASAERALTEMNRIK